MMILSFQSTPSAWRETHTPPKLHQLPHISIHSLRMEGDPVSSGKTIRQSISIHSLRMEGDEMSTVSEYVGEVFQSTPSAWRETIMYFVSKMEKLISIHSLRMEGDSKENIVSSPFRKFQSTPSAWRETLLLPFFLFSRSHFNPLPPHGGRPVLTSILRSNPAFQSTPSAWRETYGGKNYENSCTYFNPLPPHGGRRPA